MNTNAALCMGLDAGSRAKRLPRRWPDLPSDLVVRDGAQELIDHSPELRTLIAEACEKIREFFGPEPGLALKPFVDPDSPSEAPTLFLLVCTHQPAEEAGAAMDRFEESWWFDNAHRADGLHINLEFV